MANYEVDIEVPTQVVKFNFTPTLENAHLLLLDIATLIENVSVSADVEELKQQILLLRQENTDLRTRNSALVQQLKAISEINRLKTSKPVDEKPAAPLVSQPQEKPRTSIPKIGEVVQIKPHGEYKFYTNGTVKGFKGRGAKYVIVRPLNHAQDEAILRRFIKRFAANERKIEDAAANH